MPERAARAVAFSVDVYSDTICPWCFLGKRRLEAALRERPGLAVAVRWRPFELNPDMAPEGEDRVTYLERKFGDPARLEDAHRHLVELGREAGISFGFERIARIPNTRASHVLAAAAGERQDAVVEALFHAYFEDGRDIGDLDVLADVASACGLDGAAERRRLAAAQGFEALGAELRASAALGISGVPCFVLGGRWALSGAQETGRFVAALDHVATELGRDPRLP